MSIVALAGLVPGCTKQAVTPSPVVQTAPERHLGQVVEIRGEAVRAKLGDLIQAEGFSVYCIDRLPDELLGQVVAVRGTLDRRDTGARVAADGAISQGTAPGTRSLVMKGCQVVAGSGAP